MTRLQMDSKSVMLRTMKQLEKDRGEKPITLFVDEGGTGKSHELAVTLFLDYKTAKVTGALVVDLSTDSDTLLVAMQSLKRREPHKSSL